MMARSDPFEGILPASRFIHRKWSSLNDAPDRIKERVSGFMKPNESDKLIGFQRLKDLAELRIRQAYAHRRSYFINCWHLSEFESSAMWDIYSQKNEGIAIISSESQFKKSFSEIPQDIMGGLIEYGDYNDEEFEMEDGNGFTPVLHKRNSFSYENEYRLAYWDTSVTHKTLIAKNGFFNWDGKILPDVTGSGRTTVGRSENEIETLDIKPGFSLDCDINELIQEIYVSPLADDWFFEMITDVSKKYGIDAPVRRSELLSSPMK